MNVLAKAFAAVSGSPSAEESSTRHLLLIWRSWMDCFVVSFVVSFALDIVAFVFLPQWSHSYTNPQHTYLDSEQFEKFLLEKKEVNRSKKNK